MFLLNSLKRFPCLLLPVSLVVEKTGTNSENMKNDEQRINKYYNSISFIFIDYPI